MCCVCCSRAHGIECVSVCLQDVGKMRGKRSKGHNKEKLKAVNSSDHWNGLFVLPERDVAATTLLSPEDDEMCVCVCVHMYVC